MCNVPSQDGTIHERTQATSTDTRNSMYQYLRMESTVMNFPLSAYAFAPRSTLVYSNSRQLVIEPPLSYFLFRDAANNRFNPVKLIKQAMYKHFLRQSGRQTPDDPKKQSHNNQELPPVHSYPLDGHDTTENRKAPSFR